MKGVWSTCYLIRYEVCYIRNTLLLERTLHHGGIYLRVQCLSLGNEIPVARRNNVYVSFSYGVLPITTRIRFVN